MSTVAAKKKKGPSRAERDAIVFGDDPLGLNAAPPTTATTTTTAAPPSSTTGTEVKTPAAATDATEAADAKTARGTATRVDVVWGSCRVRMPDGMVKEVEKDVRAWPGHVERWRWDRCGTTHAGGPTREAVKPLLPHVDAIVCSTGMEGRLRAPQESVRRFAASKTLVVLPSDAAAAEYNRRASKGERVGLLLHSTC